MVIKLYISGISGNKEVKKKQQRVQMILDSKQIDYEAIDITEPGKEKDKEFMQQNGKVRESLGKYPLPPQIFNDEDFCGDYEDFDLANEVDELEKFLHIEVSSKDNHNDSKVNGLKEEGISENDLIGIIEKSEEITKKEVNGESESVPPVESSSENIETLGKEVPAPETEETTSEEKPANDDENGEKESKEVAESNEEEEEAKEPEVEETVETRNEEEVENEENSSPPEEKKTDEAEEEGEKVESEKEENESENDAAESENSQEE